MRPRNKFVEIVNVAERCLMIYYKMSSQEWAMANLPSRKSTDGRMSKKGKKHSSYLTYDFASLSKTAGKTDPLSWNIIWT